MGRLPLSLEVNDDPPLSTLRPHLFLCLPALPPGSRGIGLYTATAFLLAGCAKVIITARDAKNLSSAAAKLNALPDIFGKAVAIPANVGHTDQIERFVKDVEDESKRDGGHGGVDILVTNAASSWGGPFEEFEDWKSVKTLDLNVRGVFNLVRLYGCPPPPVSSLRHLHVD